jgi:hypothetical protein
MTRHEAAVVAAYTGILIGDFAEMHRYIEKILDRPVWTHELANSAMWDQIKAAARSDFLAIEVAAS